MREREREKSAGALRYSRASDSPRASTCSTCPTFQDLLSWHPGPPRARARAYIQTRAKMYSMGPISLEYLVLAYQREDHHLLSSLSYTLPHHLVSPRCTGERFVLVYLIGIREVCSRLVGK